MKFIIPLLLLLALTGEVAAQTANGNASATAAAGNSNATAVNGSGNTQSITFQGDLPKLLPQPPVAGVSVPQVFQFLPNQAGMPVELTAAALDNAYLVACRPRGGRSASQPVFGNGDSGRTKFSFSGHQNLQELILPQGEVPVVEVDLSGGATVRCLGKVTITVTPEAAKEGYPIDLTALSEDAMNSVAKLLTGVKGDVVLLSHLGFWGGGLGLAGQGDGSTGGFGINFGINLGMGKSNTSGTNFPMSRGGMSFIVGLRVADGDPQGVKIVLQPKESQPVPAVGGDGKKFQGTR